jgi:hypothetical protein
MRSTLLRPRTLTKDNGPFPGINDKLGTMAQFELIRNTSELDGGYAWWDTNPKDSTLVSLRQDKVDKELMKGE